MSQSLAQLWTHIIFSTKNRYPFFNTPALRQRIYDYIAGICRAQNCHAVSIGGAEDHIHLLVQLHKNVALADFIEEVKKSCSKWIKSLDNDSNRLKNFYWQRGYAAFSVSQSQLEIVKRYINNQEQHHKKKNFQDELRNFLSHHDIRYDEKYLWE